MKHIWAIIAAVLALAGPALAPSSIAAAQPPAPAASGPGYTYYEIGDLQAKRPGPTEAGLMLHGGGDWSKEAFHWLAARAGGGRIVVLRASYGGENGVEIFHDIGGVTAVQTLVFTSRKAASDPRVLDIVRGADGIFMGGGDQSKYVRFWKGTPLNELINVHVRAGKPIGGTSAGLAVIGAYSYGAMDGGSVTSPVALKDPMGSEVTLVRDFLRLHHMDRIITDSHFAARDRQGRLITFIARLAREQNDPSITGIGVDEETALCVDAAGIGRVFSNIGAHAWVMRPMRQAEILRRGRPLTFTKVPIIGLGAASRIDLNTFEITDPAFEKVADVKAGKIEIRPRLADH